MKKISRYRPNTNFIYSLNYKFDSTSVAGKVNGTALELIKKYNDFAKEAHGNGDYVNAEIFRQYAEHYRKIVTEINERKAVRNNADTPYGAENAENSNEAAVKPEGSEVAAGENEPNAEQAKPEVASPEAVVEMMPKENKRSFQVIEISSAKEETAEIPVKTKRAYRKKTAG